MKRYKDKSAGFTTRRLIPTTYCTMQQMQIKAQIKIHADMHIKLDFKKKQLSLSTHLEVQCTYWDANYN